VARPSGTVTFLFTDIEGSTRLWDEHPHEMRRALGLHDQILRESIDAHAGFVFARAGDGVAAAFERAGEALAAAVAAQRALLGMAWPTGIELRIRMGLHTGEADERDGDYLGPPVNRAARLMSAAHGGQIVVTSTTADVLWPLTNVELLDLGTVSLRGINDPIHAFGVRADGVPWPDRELSTSRTVPGNLPAPANEWFGPVAELHRRVADLPNRRLVTLTGTGGVGKTRLALEVAAMATDEFRDGVWMIELAPVADPSAVAAAVATTLSVQPHAGVSVVESIADWLRGRRLLLLLDNCEHVLTAVGDLAEAIVAHCPTTTVLATSREPLGVSGERVVPVARLDSSDAAALFRDRALAVDDSLKFSESDEVAIAGICEELDGIPLAIELAAARARALTPKELVGRLADRLHLLRASGRSGSERHRTLEATVAWSYQLLSPRERLLFERLGVFAGGFDLTAVDAVCADPPLAALDLFEVLASLVDKSMVTAEHRGERTRYRLLETLRQFAMQRLEDSCDVGARLERHLGYYVGAAEQANRLWASPSQLDGDDIFDREWDNIRAALAWAITTANVNAADRIVAATGRHARARARLEHGEWAERTLRLESAGHQPRSTTYAWAARAACAIGDYDAALAFAEQGIAAAPSPTHPDAAGCWGWVIGAHVSSGRGAATIGPARQLARIEPKLSEPVVHWTAVTELIESGLANDRRAVPALVERLGVLADKIGAPSILSETVRYRALSALYARDPRDAKSAVEACQEGIELARSVHDLSAEAINLSALALAVAALHTPDAGDVCRDAIVRLYDLRFWNVLWVVIETAAGSLAGASHFEEAAVVYGHLEAHRPPWGIPAARRARERGLDRIRRLPQLDSLMARGRAMDRDEVVAYLLDQLSPAGE
jgi:predicted ATPase/class 3 adenylate cyclase